jgi:hypothetical protein
MGIADGIDRLLRTLRSPAAAPVSGVSDPTAELPATTSGNGRDPVTAEPQPTAPTTERPSSKPASEEPVTKSLDALTGALTTRVEEAYQAHREKAVTGEPTGAATLAADDDTTDALPVAEPEHTSVETPERVDKESAAKQASVGEPTVADDPPQLDVVVLPPVIEDADAILNEVALGREPPALPATTPALHADSLARLEAAAGIAESLGLGFHLGGAVERIAFGASQGREGVDALREATWLIERYVALVEQRPVGADLHASTVRLGRSGDAIAEIRALTAALDASRDTRLAALGASPAPPQPVAPEPASPSASLPSASDSAPRDASAPEPRIPEAERESFSHEVALMAVRWAIMVVAVIAVVLAVTLIGEWL